MPLDDETRAVLEGLLARIDVDEHVANVERDIARMPEYRGFVEGEEDAADRGAAGIRWNLEIFVRWATDGRPLSRDERERLRELIGARAAEGRPPAEGLAVYRRAMRSAWETAVASADERERAALGSAFEVLLEWLEIVSAIFDEAYAEERDALVGPDERRARWLFELITAEEEPQGDERRLADALGFELAGAYRPVVAALEGGSAVDHLRVAAALREQRMLAISEGRRTVALAHRPADVARLGSGERLIVCESDPAPRGELAEALGDLRSVVTIAAGAGERGAIDPDARIPELFVARSPRLAERLRRRVFGRLLDAGQDELARTLEVLAEHGFERAATAAALPVHRNTLVQRIARIEELSGLDLDDPRDRGAIWLASLAGVHGAHPGG